MRFARLIRRLPRSCSSPDDRIPRVFPRLPASSRFPKMRFYADLHIHSKYSRATSRDLDFHHLVLWAKKKGVTVVGTGVV